MIVKELLLKNFRGHRDPEPFKFSGRFTVIAGVNGKGKTALLESLTIALSRLLPQISPAKSIQRRLTERDIHLGTRKATIKVLTDCKGLPVRFEVNAGRSSVKPHETKLSGVLREEIRKSYGDPDAFDKVAPLAIYYSTDRASFRAPQTSVHAIDLSAEASAYAGALRGGFLDLGDFVARYVVALRLRDERVTKRSPKSATIMTEATAHAIEIALTQFIDGIKEIRPAPRPWRLEVKKGAHWLRVLQLSDGERSLLAIVCDLGRRLALANPDLRNPMKGSGVVLIDELELHLHPKWQRSVVENLKRTFPNIQFICTTHSPFIIQSLQPGELISLDQDDPDLAQGEMSRLESALFSDQSIEDITEDVMGVKLPQKSKRFSDMMDAAEEYFTLLRSAGRRRADLEEIERRLDELAMPFSDDPGFQALLKVERLALLGEGETNEAR